MAWNLKRVIHVVSFGLLGSGEEDSSSGNTSDNKNSGSWDDSASSGGGASDNRDERRKDGKPNKEKPRVLAPQAAALQPVIVNRAQDEAQLANNVNQTKEMQQQKEPPLQQQTQQQTQQTQQQPHVRVYQAPETIIKTVSLTLEQCFNGCSIPLEIDRQVPDNDIIKIERETIHAQIPKGIVGGETIILTECGHMNEAGMKGDIRIVINVLQ
ncbi:MAG: hypothetical protein EBR02_06975, partial [Alphaproteobacteria bacterium]|nr:hypothetical protein [Alphaproteobacteria bacterium]